MKILYILLLLCSISSVCYAGDRPSLGERISEAEYRFYQVYARVEVIYAMTKEIYLQTHTKEEYEDLVLNAGRKKK